jgi:hypothetical protein
MVKKALWAAVPLSLLLASVAVADDRKEIEALYGKLRQALLAGRYEDTLALETSDFKARQPGGTTLTGKQLVDQMKTQGSIMKLKSMTISLTRVVIGGKSARVETRFTGSSDVVDDTGQMGPKGKKHVLTISGRIKNTLQKTAEGWKFHTMENVSEEAKIDGKAMGMAPVGGRSKK